MNQGMFIWGNGLALLAAAALFTGTARGQGEEPPAPQGRGASSYTPVVMEEDFRTMMQGMAAAKDGVMQRLPEERCDLGDRPARA